jgi:hypothetical protein
MCLENTEPPDLSTNGAVFVKIKEIRPIIKMIDFLRKLNLVLIAKSVFVWFYRAVFVTFKNSYYSGFSISDPPPLRQHHVLVDAFDTRMSFCRFYQKPVKLADFLFEI